MRLLRFGASALCVSLLLGSLALLAGCGRTSTEDDEVEDAPIKKRVEEKLVPMPATGKGTLEGKVTLAGSLPDIDKLNAEQEATLDRAQSSKGCSNRKQQVWVMGKGNGLGNVVVMLRPEKGQFFAVQPDDLAEVTDVRIDQPGCSFQNHVVAYFPQYPDPSGKKGFIKTGKKLLVLNNDPVGISHNFTFNGGPRNGGEVNKPASPKQVLEFELTPASDAIKGACGIHPWMSCWIWVVDHPYYAVTDADGHFEIKNVPAGKCRIAYWHEELKFGNPGGFDGESIELKAGQNGKDITFTRK